MSWIFSALSFCCFKWLSLLPGVLLLMYFLIWIVKKYFCLSNKIYKCDMDCVIMFSSHTADGTPSTLKPSYVSAVKAVQDKSALYRSINCRTKPQFLWFCHCTPKQLICNWSADNQRIKIHWTIDWHMASWPAEACSLMFYDKWSRQSEVYSHCWISNL